MKHFSLFYENPQDKAERFTNVPINLKDKLKFPMENDINNLVKENKVLMKYGGEVSFAESLYPNLSKKIGSNTVYEISLLSNIIGMQVRLHSLLAMPQLR